VEISVLLDTRLSGDFRTGLKEVLERRLAGQGLRAKVRENLIKMPLPQDLPQPPPPMMPQQPQPQPAAAPRDRPAPEPEKAAAPKVAQPEPDRGPRALDRLLDALPLMLGLILCAGIVAYTLRQYARILEARQQPGGAADPGRPAPDATTIDARAEEVRVDRQLAALAARLEESPALRRDLFVTWLREAQPEELATAFSLLGPGIFGEVHADPECAAGLDAVAEYIANTEPDLSLAAKQRLAATVRRRLLHLQVRRGGDSVADAVARLAPANARAFAALLALEDEEVQVGILREAPARLQKAVFETRSTAEQARLVRALITPSNCSRERLLGAATRLVAQLGAQHASGGKVEAASGLIESVDGPQRRRILLALHSTDEVAYRNLLSDFVTEETLGALPKEVLGAACLRLGVGDLAVALKALPHAVSRHVLASLTAQQARSVEDETAALSAEARERGEAAVRQLLATVRREARTQGVDLYAINHRVLAELRRDEGAVA
jgi:hypothetical protein